MALPYLCTRCGRSAARVCGHVALLPHLEHKYRSEEHTSELQSRPHLVCRLLLEKKKKAPTLSSPNLPPCPITVSNGACTTAVSAASPTGLSTSAYTTHRCVHLYTVRHALLYTAQ